MITKLPKYWFIRITAETIESINKFRHNDPRAYSKKSIDKLGERYLYEVLVATNEGFGHGTSLNFVLHPDHTYTELTLEEFRRLVVGDLKISIKERIKLLKI